MKNITVEKEKKFISLVAYVHDCEEQITPFLDKIVTKLVNKFAQIELIFVDDDAVGNEIAIIRDFCEQKLPNVMVTILHMSYYQGLESAMNAGRDLSIGDFVIEFDSMVVDYRDEVPDQVYDKMLEGYDVVSASSSVKPKLTSRIFYRVYNKYSREKSGRLVNETFRIITRRAINRAKSQGSFIPYRKAVYSNSGLKTSNIVYESTTGKRAKAENSSRVGLALDSFVYFTNFLERVSVFLSGTFLLFTIGIVVYILCDIFLRHATADGWLSIMGFLSVGFFGVFLLLTIILKYLSTMLKVVFRQKSYVISDIEKISK